MTRRDEIVEIAERVAEAEGVDLYWVKYQNGKSTQRVQIMIDKAEGISHTDCARVSRSIESLLDEKIDHKYELEVSSPGIERPLFEQRHYMPVIGQEIKVKSYGPIEGSKVWTGILKEVQENVILILTSKGLLEIPLDQIAQAHVSPQFDFS